MVTVSAITALCPSSELAAATARGRRKRCLHPQPQNCHWGGGGGALGREAPWGSRGGAEVEGTSQQGRYQCVEAPDRARRLLTPEPPPPAWPHGAGDGPPARPSSWGPTAWRWGRATAVLAPQGQTPEGGGQGSPAAASLPSREAGDVKPGRDAEPVISPRPAAHGGSCCPLAPLPFPSHLPQPQLSRPRALKNSTGKATELLGAFLPAAGFGLAAPSPAAGAADPNGVCGQDRGAEGLRTPGGRENRAGTGG